MDKIDIPTELQTLLQNAQVRIDALQKQASLAIETAKLIQQQQQTMLIAFAYGKGLDPADWKLEESGTSLIPLPKPTPLPDQRKPHIVSKESDPQPPQL